MTAMWTAEGGNLTLQFYDSDGVRTWTVRIAQQDASRLRDWLVSAGDYWDWAHFANDF